MCDDDAARREARKLALIRVAGGAGANFSTPFFATPFGAAVGASVAPDLARPAS
jgi:hypothetical protein